MKHYSIKFKIYPNKDQIQQLNQNIGSCRFVYNHFLALKIKYYKKTGENISYFELNKLLTDIKQKKKYRWLYEAINQSLQQSLKDLDAAYKNFFKHGKGFPKFKKKGIKDSFRLNLNILIAENYIRLAKFGYVKAKGSFDRIEEHSKLKFLTVTKEAGSFYCSCTFEREAKGIKVLNKNAKAHIHKHQAIGIDLGVKRPLQAAYLSNNDNLGIFKLGLKFKKDLEQKELRRKRYQRQLSRKTKGSKNFLKAKIKVQKAFQREKNLRKDYIEKTSHRLCQDFKQITFEALKLKNMTKSAKGTKDNPGVGVKAKSGLNREILRLGHSALVTRTSQKSKRFNTEVYLVTPKHTSRECSCCGCVSKLNRKSQAIFKCISCGYTDNADVNAAMNILMSTKLVA